jgi:soluble lytic murein transglycosylase-like protein
VSVGPVPSPDQVEADSAPVRSPSVPTAAASPSSSNLPRRFDPIFERHRGDIPIEYLRALAIRESSMNPRVKGAAAWGLLQITEVVRHDYNRAHRTSHTREQLLNPDINVRIATWLLRTIADSYRRHHPDVPNLRPDWSNPRFVELLTFGWNAGASEAGGVGRVVGYLERKGAREIDLDLVHAHARTAGASEHLSNPAKARWSRGVAALYRLERELASNATVAAIS